MMMDFWHIFFVGGQKGGVFVSKKTLLKSRNKSTNEARAPLYGSSFVVWRNNKSHFNIFFRTEEEEEEEERFWFLVTAFIIIIIIIIITNARFVVTLCEDGFVEVFWNTRGCTLSDEKAETMMMTTTMTTTGRKRKGSGGETPTLTTDLDELKKHHAFLRDDRENDEEEEEKKKKNAREGERMAIKYEEKLFKEYAIPDLSRCDEGVGLRWRTKQEVARGKGVDVCGEKRCSQRRNLGTFELNFRYKERGEVKNALVKVVVCPACEEKLHRSRRKKKKK